VIAMKKNRITYRLCALLVLVAAIQTGCNSHHHDVYTGFIEDFGAPGSVFVITGAGFDPDAVVWFDGSSAAVYVHDSWTIYGVVPDLPGGVVAVDIVNPSSGMSWGPLLFSVEIPPVTGDIEGFAYFPQEDPWGNYPAYYDTGNELILVTLYDADDIYYMFPLRDNFPLLTDTTGYFLFTDLAPDWYFLTAEAETYDPVFDITDFYWAETLDFDLLPGELRFRELYLLWFDWQYGRTLGATLLKGISEQGSEQVAPSSNLERFRAARSERFRLEGRQRPVELRVKVPSEQTEPESQQD
jgi:hypothetical protein